MTTEDEGASVIRIGKVNIETGVIEPSNKCLVKLVYIASGYQIPNDIVEIEGGAFSHCINLTGITVPNTILRMGDGVFANTLSLRNVELPNTMVS